MDSSQPMGHGGVIDSIEYRPSQTQRRRLLTLTLIFWLLFFAGAAGVALAPKVPGGGTGLLVLPGLIGLFLGPPTLHIACGRTFLSPRGIRTGGFFRRRAFRWSDVAVIEAKKFEGGRGLTNTRISVQLTSGRSFKLAAPFDSSNGRDPEFYTKLMQIQAYWAAHRPSDN